jgi:hypothetical protein
MALVSQRPFHTAPAGGAKPGSFTALTNAGEIESVREGGATVVSARAGREGQAEDKKTTVSVEHGDDVRQERVLRN